MKEFLLNHIDSILAYLFGAGGLFTAWTEKKKRKTDALSALQLVYDKFIEDYDKKFEEIRSEIATLKSTHQEEIAKLQSKLEKVEAFWKQKYTALKSTHQEEIAKLQSKLEKVEAFWKQKYTALKTAFDQYKKTHP